MDKQTDDGDMLDLRKFADHDVDDEDAADLLPLKLHENKGKRCHR